MILNRLEIAEVLGEASALIGAHALAFIVATAIYVVFGIWIEDHDESWSAQATMLIAPVLLQGLLQYLLFRQAFGDVGGGWVGGVVAPFTVIGLQFGIWLICGLGYFLLLLPGLYLAARTSAAIGMAAVERTGPIDSIVGSWHRTRRSAWPLVVVHAILLFPIVALLVGMFGTIILDQGIEYESIEFRVVANLVFGVVTMAGWAVAGAVYRLTAPPRGGHEDIFA
ncbi:hypothetical protein LRS12_08700 [Sphingomonas sp. J344]|uniref:hypothetical protein n=1 Tax=Sphingomonas sp. J344 TaxID=2898434 RepID=UPI0021512F08|nr:hypothetical protein [Sphingomonas sp. J344]MCR5870778.1 hypothetical protein [Sphingomonas sp. J344]